MNPGGPVLVLAGGVGAARFLRGLVQVVEPADLVVVVNTGDDLRWHGLYVAPDLDTIMYWLAGLADEERGWGIRGDTFATQGAFARLGLETWFQLGDQDLATHVYRTERLAAGVSLDRVTDDLAARLHVRARLLPMSNEPVTTRLRTDRGDSHFQEYFVRDRCQPAVHEIYWTGLEAARPAPGIAEAIASARAIVIAPSNPIISIGPILRVPGMRELLAPARGRCVAVSPLIAGRAVKGPTVELMRAQGLEASALGVAELYRDLASAFILDAADVGLGPATSGLGYRVATMPTLLDDRQAAQAVAATALNLVQTEMAA
ncbi:MAG: 2-phospho-L-lactate transferase [Chloroflexi bacterium]|nr:MAG: 2-phospho-L-lactate transferase [Chloroflexota bacterium]